MCGLAGYSLGPESRVERTLAAQALLAGIAERGADAVGYAYRGESGPVQTTKLQGGASSLLDELDIPPTAVQALLHVRDFTKGRPEVEANNHPIRHGALVGVHNGVISNDDALLGRRQQTSVADLAHVQLEGVVRARTGQRRVLARGRLLRGSRCLFVRGVEEMLGRVALHGASIGACVAPLEGLHFRRGIPRSGQNAD